MKSTGNSSFLEKSKTQERGKGPGGADLSASPITEACLTDSQKATALSSVARCVAHWGCQCQTLWESTGQEEPEKPLLWVWQTGSPNPDLGPSPTPLQPTPLQG